MNEWINHPAMENLDPLKLELIKKAAEQTRGKNGKSLAPVMMALIHAANQKGVRFTSEEMDLILSLMKEGKSEAEKQQIDQTIAMVSSLMKTQTKEK
ncbi:hypothetical protein [Lachnoclostridium sp. An181]|uniref:hypothetical protein n=1 Tax=Lachnoclostridium sp. An181 TaxID=1965575 RepID=UPI000B37B37B|nr:hypothetical protein [Lachnoclostridium sp. An181]OUP49937.1 hypothetical protein B5F18_05480 [Lachnoclostridium sp. An181]